MAETPWQDDEVLAAHYVIHQLDDPALAKTPGDFASRIIEALCFADRENIARLRLGFPALADAVDLYKNTWNGVNTLRKRAGIPQNPIWPAADE